MSAFAERTVPDPQNGSSNVAHFWFHASEVIIMQADFGGSIPALVRGRPKSRLPMHGSLEWFLFVREFVRNEQDILRLRRASRLFHNTRESRFASLHVTNGTFLSRCFYFLSKCVRLFSRELLMDRLDHKQTIQRYFILPAAFVACMAIVCGAILIPLFELPNDFSILIIPERRS